MSTRCGAVLAQVSQAAAENDTPLPYQFRYDTELLKGEVDNEKAR